MIAVANLQMSSKKIYIYIYTLEKWVQWAHIHKSEAFFHFETFHFPRTRHDCLSARLTSGKISSAQLHSSLLTAVIPLPSQNSVPTARSFFSYSVSFHPLSLWWLISCISLIGSRGTQMFGQTLFRVFLHR